MFDWFLNFFMDIFNIVMALIFTLVGILIGIIIFRYLRRQKNQIFYCRERDGRGLELDISEEDAISLETDTKPQLRFFKYGRSYDFFKRGRVFSRFFGKEGTAYTWLLEGFHRVATKFKKVREVEEVPDGKGGMTKQKVTKEVPIEFENKQIELEFDTLEDAVKARWGDEFYATVPDKMQGLLRDDQLLVTVGLEPGIVPEGYEPITESVITRKGDESMAKLIGESAKQATKKDVLERIAWIGTGAAIPLAAIALGII